MVMTSSSRRTTRSDVTKGRDRDGSKNKVTTEVSREIGGVFTPSLYTDMDPYESQEDTKGIFYECID
jgi:hypothetical protein